MLRGIGAPKISLVNEVQCGTGTEKRDLIGQQCGYGLACVVHELSSGSFSRVPPAFDVW